MMHLGTLALPVQAIQGITLGEGSAYATHEVIEGKAKKQYIAENASDLTLSLKLHAEWTNPQATIDALRALRAEREAMALQTLAGDVWGFFVIESMQVRTMWMFDDGTLMAALVDLKLSDPGVEATLARVRPSGVRDNAEDIVTTPKGEGDTQAAPGSVTTAQIVRR